MRDNPLAWTTLFACLGLLACSAPADQDEMTGTPERPAGGRDDSGVLQVRSFAAQDDIIIDPTTHSDEVRIESTHMTRGSGAPGKTMVLRSDILDRAADYVLCYCDDGVQPGACGSGQEHDADRVEYTVNDLAGRAHATNTIRIDRYIDSGNPRLKVYVKHGAGTFNELESQTERCDYMKAAVPKCIGTGMPVEAYGQLPSGEVTVCKSLEGGSCKEGEEISGKHVIRLRHSKTCP